MQNRSWAEIAIPSGVDLLLTYEIPLEMQDQVEVGQMVHVPLGRRKVWGMILRFAPNKPQGFHLKSILGVLDLRIDPSCVHFWQWLGEYYLSNWSRVLDIALPSHWDEFAHKKTRKSSTLKSADLNFEEQAPLHQLNEEQVIALKQFSQNPCQAYLLWGVTGSGKTLVLQEMARQILNVQGNILWLLPEIALTPQMHHRLEAGLGQKIHLWHSGLSPAQKRQTWQDLNENRVKILMGTRSALLMPLQNTKLIIIDEEHDNSYKQVDPSPRYHARDAALWKAHQLGISIVLASATPSMEVFHRAQLGKITVLRLQNRANEASLPVVRVVNLQEQREIQGDLCLSVPLREAISGVLDRGEQVILLHNRRGYAAAYLCKKCAEACKCHSCDVSLTLHRKTGRLHCHYCDQQFSVQQKCNHCHSEEWVEVGHAIERVEEELQDFFPQTKILRLDRDSTTLKGSTEQILGQFARGEAQILLGTQMVVKGHDFSKVTLVGVIAADQALQIPDFRSAENAFQLLTQVAGRAGRGQLKGEVILQSYRPEDPVMQLAMNQDYQAFYAREIQNRQMLNYPPYHRILKIELTATKIQGLREYLQRLAIMMQSHAPELRILGPAESAIFRMRGQYRFQVMIFAVSPQKIRLAYEAALAKMPQLPPGSRLNLDMDARGF